MQDELTECSAILTRSERLLVITGAGISAESGIPTYRGPGGLYSGTSEAPAAMSAEGFRRDPEMVWRHIDEMRAVAAAAQPNTAHQILAKWEKEDRFSGLLIATQNIDGLHLKAGSDRLTELHGSLWQMAQPRLVDFTEDEQFSEDVELMAYPEMRDEILRRWSEENRQQIWEDRTVPFARVPPHSDPDIRPNILLYNEDYGSRLVWVEDFIKSKPDAVLVIGCSGGVTILDLLLKGCREANPNCEIININPHEDCIEMPHRYIAATASEVLTAIDCHLA